MPALYPLRDLIVTAAFAVFFIPMVLPAISSAAESESADSGHLETSKPISRTDRLVEQARDENWDADQLFVHLNLDEPQQCQNFSNRAHLRERQARWREAVDLLERIDPDHVDAWLLGDGDAPRIPTAETKRQLRCMLADLIAASLTSSYDIRLFTNPNAYFGGRYTEAADLARAIERRPRMLDRTINALTRSVTRNIHSQGFIWYRKFAFTGRSFNRISPHAAQRCSLTAGHTWKPDNRRHQRCWRTQLSATEREQEVLTASAAPGLSRHHWGTDVDILGLNPVHFVEGGRLHDDWRWLDDHALDYGFFQTYGDPGDEPYAHMEERWHWSYYPIAQALWEFVEDNQERVEQALFERWNRLERRWGGAHGPYFDHMREYWRDYLFNIDLPRVDARHSVGTQDAPTTPLP